jgi:hypothetical protein
MSCGSTLKAAYPVILPFRPCSAAKSVFSRLITGGLVLDFKAWSRTARVDMIRGENARTSPMEKFNDGPPASIDLLVAAVYGLSDDAGCSRPHSNSGARSADDAPYEEEMPRKRSVINGADGRRHVSFLALGLLRFRTSCC